MAHPLYARLPLLNKMMQLNMACIMLHFLLYGRMPEILLGLRNPFSDLLLAIAVVAGIGLLFLFDYLLPFYLEAKRRRFGDISRPVGCLLTLNFICLLGYSASWL
jgi:hypothetical protein